MERVRKSPLVPSPKPSKPEQTPLTGDPSEGGGLHPGGGQRRVWAENVDRCCLLLFVSRVMYQCRASGFKVFLEGLQVESFRAEWDAGWICLQAAPEIEARKKQNACDMSDMRSMLKRPCHHPEFLSSNCKP